MSDSSQSPRDPSGGVGVGESDRGESEGLLKLRAVVRLQSAMRRFRDRVRVVRILRSRFEKIYDIKRSRFYYYDQITDISSWRKPRLFRKQDVQFVSPMYTPQTAAETVQKHMRRYMALMRVRLLYQSRVSAVPDARTGGTYYYNSYEGQAMWELPKFMKGRLNHKRRADRRPGDSESESDGGSGNESDSEAEKLRRKMARKMPRSKIQLLVDAAEDDWASKEIHMDLSGFQSAYISSRIYDVAALHTLNLENNKITKLSDQISYLSKYVSIYRA